MSDANFMIIWEFQVKTEAISRFERTYGPDGDWAQLFQYSRDYSGTILLRDADRPGRYLTLDRWTSREALQRFKRDHRVEYELLDQRCDNLTEQETCIGDFEQSL